MIGKMVARGFAIALALSPAALAHAGRSAGSDEARLAACIVEAAEGRRWLETTLWGLRDQEGGWIGAQVRNRNGTHDLGPLQINSSWVSKLAKLTGRQAIHIRWWLVHDPCFNVRAARWIFLSALSQTRDYWKAIGVYHSPALRRQADYAANVALHMRNRFDVHSIGEESLAHRSRQFPSHPRQRKVDVRKAS
jgi:hypothetical protein